MRKNASHPDSENPEWTPDELRQARPLMDALPKQTAAAIRRYRGQRGPQKSPTKELISLRVDRDVVAAYRARGSGWQQQANDALRAYMSRDGMSAKRGRKKNARSRSRRSVPR